MTYATLGQLKSQLGITVTTHDSYLSDLLERATAVVNTLTNRSFTTSVQTVTDELYERQGDTIYLPHLDVTNVTAVKTRELRTDALVTLAAGTYNWYSNGRVSLPMSSRYVQVSYTYGGGNVPRDIELACLQIASDHFKATANDTTPSSERIGDYQVTYDRKADIAKSASFQTEKLLASYRVRPV